MSTYQSTFTARDRKAYLEVMEQAKDPRHVRCALRTRHKTTLKRLPAAQRRSWLSAEVARFMKMPLLDRFDALFTRNVTEGIWQIRQIIDRNGRPVGEISRLGDFPEPRVTLQAADGTETTVWIGDPLPEIHSRIDAFVKKQRALTLHRVRRGPKRGSIQRASDPGTQGLAFFLTYLHTHRRVSPTALLRLCGREPLRSAYRWLEIKFRLGRRMLHRYEHSIARLNSLDRSTVEEFVKVMLTDPIAEPIRLR